MVRYSRFKELSLRALHNEKQGTHENILYKMPTHPTSTLNFNQHNQNHHGRFQSFLMETTNSSSCSIFLCLFYISCLDISPKAKMLMATATNNAKCDWLFYFVLRIKLSWRQSEKGNNFFPCGRAEYPLTKSSVTLRLSCSKHSEFYL
jgi:hypothetical protein